MVLAIVCVPPFILAYSGMVGFVNALYFAGVFSGVILSIMPILMLRSARKSRRHRPGLAMRLDCPSADPGHGGGAVPSQHGLRHLRGTGLVACQLVGFCGYAS